MNRRQLALLIGTAVVYGIDTGVTIAAPWFGSPLWVGPLHSFSTGVAIAWLCAACVHFTLKERGKAR